MDSIIYLLNSFYFSLLWEQKINILSGFFLGLAIYSYFYRRKTIKKEIIKLKKDAIILRNVKNNLIIKIMSENEKFTIKEMLMNMSEDFKAFKTEVREDIKDLTKLFSDYKISNNERISLLEGSQKMTKKTIAMYVGFVGAFIMLVVNTYMSFK